ncbi:MAG: winged helix-turn-helix domain-containing protein [Erysipelotrichaceae bacterium]|nr:winged helix-turn-helix domain-containing protein [Erysipelotrichaceae bacterium]
MVEFRLLGSFTAIVNGKSINLEKILGRQMSNLFALFIYHHGEVIGKDQLINWIWPESDNPSNAIKYGIFRLRNALREIEGFEDVEWIVTAKGGYKFTDEVDYSVDTDLFCQIFIDKGDLEQAINLYRDGFLQNTEVDWVFRERNFYLSRYLQAVKKMGETWLNWGEYDRVIEVAEKALQYDNYDEEIIELYLISLLRSGKYNEALSYYEYIAKKFEEELGLKFFFNVADHTNVTFDVERKAVTKEETFDSLITDVEESEVRKGAMLCSLDTFKDYTRFELRDGMRNRENKYIICVHLDTNEDLLMKASGEMVRSIVRSLRVNDIFTQLNPSDFAILVTIRGDKDVDIIMDRIKHVYYSAMPDSITTDTVKITVHFKNLLKEKN